jgi:hypothetical protein
MPIQDVRLGFHFPDKGLVFNNSLNLAPSFGKVPLLHSPLSWTAQNSFKHQMFTSSLYLLVQTSKSARRSNGFPTFTKWPFWSLSLSSFSAISVLVACSSDVISVTQYVGVTSHHVTSDVTAHSLPSLCMRHTECSSTSYGHSQTTSGSITFIQDNVNKIRKEKKFETGMAQCHWNF